jgi:hypothetical protein
MYLSLPLLPFPCVRQHFHVKDNVTANLLKTKLNQEPFLTVLVLVFVLLCVSSKRS